MDVSSPKTSSLTTGSSDTGPTPLGTSGVLVLTRMIFSRNVNQMVVTWDKREQDSTCENTSRLDNELCCHFASFVDISVMSGLPASLFKKTIIYFMDKITMQFFFIASFHVRNDLLIIVKRINEIHKDWHKWYSFESRNFIVCWNIPQ